MRPLADFVHAVSDLLGGLIKFFQGLGDMLSGLGDLW